MIPPKKLAMLLKAAGAGVVLLEGRRRISAGDARKAAALGRELARCFLHRIMRPE